MARQKVAVKILSRECRSGLKALRREINRYTKLQSTCPSILGSALPRMLLAWDEPNHKSVYRSIVILITEFVGKEVVRDIHEQMWLVGSEGREKVHVSEEPAVYESALQSLQKLHENGFAHGDVALRNLRISRKRNGAFSNWICWWIDLGLSTEVSTQREKIRFDLDTKKCRSLFQFA